MKQSMSMRVLSALLAVLLVLCGSPAMALDSSSSSERIGLSSSSDLPTIDKNGPRVENSSDDIFLLNDMVEGSRMLEPIETDSQLAETLFSTTDIEAQEDDVISRQAPVNNSDIYVLNPDSFRDGNPTANTLLFIPTKMDGVELAPGPDEAQLITTIPDGFIFQHRDEGSVAGYIVNIFVEGYYELRFAFVNSAGEMSNVLGYAFTVLPRGIYDTIEGTLPDSDTTDTHEITVDYDAEGTYSLGITRTGTDGFVTRVYTQDGELLKSAECSNPASTQQIRTYIDLPKPEGVNGEYTYTVEIKAKSAGKTNIGYKLAYGAFSEKMYFFEGALNCIDLPYYHTVRDTSKAEADYSSTHPTSEIGDYYLIEANGNETITLITRYDNYRYKIIDPDTFETLYDTKDFSAFREPDLGVSYHLRSDLNFSRGQYLLVIYKAHETTSPGMYSITVGQPKVKPSDCTVSISSRTVTNGQTYTWRPSVTTPNGRPAYLNKVFYSGSGAGWPFEGGYFSIQPPNSNIWISNPQQYNHEVKLDYKDPYKPLYRADGELGFRFTAKQSGTYKGNSLSISYYYEIGQPVSWNQ